MNRTLYCMAVSLCVAAVGFGAGFASAQYYQLPLYGAAAAPVAAPAAASDEEPEWAKRLESKVDRMLKLLEEIDEKAPPAGAANPEAGEMFFRDDLSATERARIAKKVERSEMPPKESEPLAPDEKAAMIAAFRGQKADDAKLASAGGKCLACHSPDSAKKKGDGFTLFQAKASK